MYIRTLILFFIFYRGTGEATECTTRGRFPNNVHSDCRGYTMCLSGGVDLTKYDLLCPEHSIYSHLESQCTNVTSYQCLPHHNCTQEGDYDNPSSEDCTSYIACVKDLNNIITARLIYCPQNEVFNSMENICVNATLFKCPFATEPPKVLQVSVNHIPTISGNFSLNNAMCIFKNGIYVTIMSSVAFSIIINI